MDPRAWDHRTAIDYVRPAVNISANAALNQVLPRCRLTRTPLLVVLNKRQEPCGIITANDAVAPLFGEFEETEL